MEFTGRKSSWEGFDLYDFTCHGRQAIVVAPKKAAEGKPWIWRPAFFGAFPSVDKALLECGFHVVYYDLTHLYGSPRAINLGNEFYNVMCNYYHMSPKVTLEGFSRGGLFAFNWAARNPDKVACIYVDAPVCNIFSWPSRRNAQLWNDFLTEWGISDQEANNFKGNPIDNLKPIVQAGIPIISVCGDNDKVVPFADNMKVVAERYRNLGGPVEVIVKPGCDHHPHSLDNPEPVVDFIVRNQPNYQKFQVINRRGSLQNSYLKFEKERRGCVAFLGGSITEMRGWRDMIKEDLKQRFPETEFTFIDAGIASTGTTPHAFRLNNDVLEKGTPDLMFVEAAVNDDANHFNYVEQTRGMEGIIRHARTVSPDMDIVMMHFIYDPFIPMLNNGIQPDVILNHERVANYYSIPSINLADEVACRMRKGEFDWDYFGGTHPAWNGHKIYAAAINHLFDMEWSGDVAQFKHQSHNIPATPLDSFCYEKGSFIDINKATQLKGWRIEEDWTPTVNVETRHGFVHVPMLVADKAGASLSLDFEGSAVGIFCVAGPDACVLEYSIDGAPFKSLDTFTEWSAHIYLP
ncbi:MAG: alpha/beta fold hydrolase, partial [Muribaculaceae bacterium]